MTKKPIGRPRLYPKGRVRHNLNIQRDSDFDTNLKIIMDSNNINQSEAVKRAVRHLARSLDPELAK